MGKNKLNLEFPLNAKMAQEAASHATFNLSCGALDNIPVHGFRWSLDPCRTIQITNVSLKCECDRLGQFGLVTIRAHNVVSWFTIFAFKGLSWLVS